MPLGSKEGLDTRIRRRNLGRGGSSRPKLASSWAKGLLSGTVDGLVGDPQVGSVLEGGVGEVSGVFGKRDRDRMSCYVVLCVRDAKSLELDVQLNALGRRISSPWRLTIIGHDEVNYAVDYVHCPICSRLDKEFKWTLAGGFQAPHSYPLETYSERDEPVEEQLEDDDGQWGRSVDPVGAVVNRTLRCHAEVEGSGAATMCNLEPQAPVRFRVNNLS
ncbi:hypothetical protein EDB80DRAFT_678584 [Ilyonectria destructans]|nr:hypothetical protein EDB80DRAFT_678584 [Ilyonectria destructans]